MQSVYYIIPTAAIGGAEKRFIELFCYLKKQQTQFTFYLILSDFLYDAVKKDDKLFSLLQPHEKSIRIFHIGLNEPVVQFQKKLYRFVCANTTGNDILHFILSFPTYIFNLKHRKTVYSLTESSLQNVNIKGRILYLLNMLRSNYTDILDPIVHKQVCRYLFFKKSSIRLTPGSFTDTDLFRPLEFHQKENLFVFLGRFFYVKQVVQLLQAIPEINSQLNAAGFNRFTFVFLGYGQEEQKMMEIIKSPVFKSLPVIISSTNAPEEMLSKSKVFFSLQLRNNYPSKSLLEAMAAGNIPLVTDVGTTRMIADPAFSYYVPEHFSANDIATQLIFILSLNEEALKDKMNLAREFVRANFSITTSANYYIDLYHELV